MLYTDMTGGDQVKLRWGGGRDVIFKYTVGSQHYIVSVVDE